jgi:hypothetical protein
MIDIELTKAEMDSFRTTIRKYRDHFDDYPGSQMVLTDAEQFARLTNDFEAAAKNPENQRAPLRPLDHEDIQITTTDKGFHIRAGKNFGVLAMTAIAYEADITKNQKLKRISEKFMPKDIGAASTAALTLK